MFAVVIIHYTKPLAEVDAVRTEHLAWIKQHTDAGTLLLSGRQTSGKGGVLVLQGTQDEAVALCATDPYAKAGVGRHEVIEFDARSGALLSAVPSR